MRPTDIFKLPLFMLLLFFAEGSCIAAGAPSAEELYFEANRAYKEDRYQDAIDGYLAMIGSGYVNGQSSGSAPSAPGQKISASPSVPTDAVGQISRLKMSERPTYNV